MTETLSTDAPDAAALQRRVAALEEALRAAEARLAALTASEARLQHILDGSDDGGWSRALLHALIDNSPAAISVRDLDGRFVLMNRHHAQLLGRDPAAVVGEIDSDVLPPESLASLRAHDRRLLADGHAIVSEETVVRADDVVTYLSTRFVIRDGDGEPAMFGTISTDISERKRAEEERAALQQHVIDVQRAALHELSTPLMPIAEGVLVMPLIGTMDGPRAHQFTEVLLTGVGAHRAHTVIIDVTGVGVVDTPVADAIVRASQAVKLLGARVVLTGIRPEVASTLVGMGADLGRIVIHGSLQRGIADTLGREAGRRRP